MLHLFRFTSPLKPLLALILAALMLPAGIAQSDPSEFAAGRAASAKRLMGCYTSWSKYNSPPFTYTAEQIPYTKLTHIIHNFLLLDQKADGTIDIPSGFLEPALLTKAHAAGVKVLVSVGGGDGTQGPLFNQMSADEAHRQTFVKNVHAFIQKYGYDGVDIDWEVPNFKDMSDCTALMQDLRKELPAGRYLISMALPSNPRTWGQGFDVPALAPLVDIMNVMTYDLTGSWAGYAGLNSPLFQDPADPNQSGSVETSMNLYANTYRVPLSELNMGTSFYGYVFTAVDALWAPCGNGCTATAQPYGSYIKSLLDSSAWKKEYDQAAASPYMVDTSADQFITYDSKASTAAKTKYVMQNNFGGVFTWDLSADYDGHSQDLLNAMYDAWGAAR